MPEIVAIGNRLNVAVATVEDCNEPLGNASDKEIDRFKDEYPDMAPFFTPGHKPAQTQASGTILSSDGDFVSAHLDTTCESFQATLPDGRVLPATRIGTDSRTGLTLFHVNADHLLAARAADAAAMRPGDLVVSVSSPQGASGTVGVGVLSNAFQLVPGALPQYLVQSDAAIHKGSAGGPLLNQYGEVLGVHSMILSRSNNFEGISFAIPVEQVLRIASDIKTLGRARYAQLGVTLEDLPVAPHSLAKVHEVTPQSAAAGQLEVGDVITHLDGHNITSTLMLTAEIARHRPGDLIHLTIQRSGRPIDVSLRLGEFIEDDDDHSREISTDEGSDEESNKPESK